MDRRWTKVQTHIHTLHSDGKDTLLDMAAAASDAGIEVICLTDHNNITGWAEIEAVEKKTNINIVRGLELTTFYGHILTIGSNFTKWQDYGINDAEKIAEQVHDHGGIAGIAHAKTIGDPFCTGCKWTFEPLEAIGFDFMEVWHQSEWIQWKLNDDLWMKWLDEGIRICGVYGADWHAVKAAVPPFNYMNLRCDLNADDAVIETILSGKVVMTYGALIDFYIDNEYSKAGIGDVLKTNSDSLCCISIKLKGIEKNDMSIIARYNNGYEIITDGIDSDVSLDIDFMIPKDISWLRLELWSEDKEDYPDAVTNPVYILP